MGLRCSKILDRFAFEERGEARCLGLARGRSEGDSGAALVLVLALVGLLTAVLLLSFVSSTKDLALVTLEDAREKSSSLAGVACRSIVSNLQSEIFAGSQDPQSPSVPAFSEVSTPSGIRFLCYPANRLAALPCQTGAGAPPNLVKWSTRSAPFFSETAAGSYPWKDIFAPAGEAASVSTADKSANGVSIPSKRWNLPLLLPKKDPSSTDLEPVGFPVPDWILMSASGESRRNLLKNVTDPIIGRYAYMVYNEGGLLDANVAGVPSSLPDAPFVPYFKRAFKGSPRLANWDPVLASAGMGAGDARAFADDLVKWRDAGVLKGADSSANYWKDLLVRPLATVGRLVPGNRAFPGRQALIQRVLKSSAGSLAARQNFLQYAGTFSRSIEQPSLLPPQPTSSFGAVPPRILAAASGGNDLWDWDTGYPSHHQHLNPPFLGVRVKNAFKRVDGSEARVGEPLVKKRFPLERLAWLTHKGPSALLASSDGDYNPDGTSEAVKACFGLTWEESSSGIYVWAYKAPRILTLNELASPVSRREPDFLELLKASIYAGVLGGGKSSVSGVAADSSLDNAVIQIAANLIDQFDADGFPTRIDFGGRQFSGVESLPYLHAVRTLVSRTEEAIHPLPDPDTGAVWKSMGATSSGGSLGTAMIWQTAAFWNPHVLSVGNPRPEKFRIMVQSGSFGVTAVRENPPATWPVSLASEAPVPNEKMVSGEQIVFTWPLAQSKLFDRPLWVGGDAPAPGPSWSMGAGNSFSGLPLPAKDLQSGSLIMGIGLAKVPLQFMGNVASPVGPPNWYKAIPSMYRLTSSPFTYRIEYENPAGSGIWVSYDEKQWTPPAEVCGVHWEPNGFDPAAADDPQYNPLEVFADPRASRFYPALGALGEKLAVLQQHYFKNDDLSLPHVIDADGLVRRAMGVQSPNQTPADDDARPRVLNRPFQSVGEMAFAFSGSPWKQLDLATPESGYAGLLDVFCVAGSTDPNAIQAGRVDLNTRQVPVLKALLDKAAWTVDGGTMFTLSDAWSNEIANRLVNRTGSKPLRNVADLSGAWEGAGSVSASTLHGSAYYDGFGKDAISMLAAYPGGAQARNAAIRVLADAGQTRVWNLLLDVIVQSGKYPAPFRGANPPLQSFTVNGEKRVWVHVALDRLTGEVIETQVEHPLE